MAKPPGLRPRGGSWEIRKRVPKRLHPAIKRGEIIRTLGGVSKQEAYRAGWHELSKIELEFEAAEIALGYRAAPAKATVAPRALTQAQLRGLAKAFVAEAEASSANDHFPLDEDRQRELSDALDEEASCVGQTGSLEDAQLQLVANAFAERLGIAIPENRFEFYGAIQVALIEVLNRQSARLAGKTIATINPAFADVGAQDAGASITLQTSISMYKARSSRSELSKSTHKMTAIRLSSLEELVGPDRKVASITRADMRAYVDDLQRMPAHLNQRFPGRTIRQASEEAEAFGAPLLSPKNLKLRVEAAASLFKWLEQEHLIERNPAKGLDTPPVPEKSDRRPFSPEELNQLLDATAEDASGKKDWAFWTVRIAALQGFRLTEPLGFEVGDIIREGAIWCLRVQPNERRGVKTEDTSRVVPMHPKLVEMGLPELARGREAKEPLFTDVPRGKGGTFNPAEKRLARLIDARVSTDPTITMHSLRHNFRDAQRAAEMPEDIAAALGGWKLDRGSSNSSMESYGSGHKTEILARWIARVEYPGARWDWRPKRTE